MLGLCAVLAFVPQSRPPLWQALAMTVVRTSQTTMDEDADRWEELGPGIKFLDVVVGSGEQATAGSSSVVRVAYTASLLSNGQEIGSTQRLGAPLRFALGSERLVFWEDAVEGMRVGGTRRLLVPPSAKLVLRASNQRMLVPEGETVTFDVELEGVESGVTAFSVRRGWSGAGSDGGRKLRITVLALSPTRPWPRLTPCGTPLPPHRGRTCHCMPCSVHPDGATCVLQVNDEVAPTPLEQQRLLREERKSDAALFGDGIEQTLYGGQR
jgi:hypothetical protein